MVHWPGTRPAADSRFVFFSRANDNELWGTVASSSFHVKTLGAEIMDTWLRTPEWAERAGGTGAKTDQVTATLDF